jgi:hypothetical protein
MGFENTSNGNACAPENPPSRVCSFGFRGTDAFKDYVSLPNARLLVDYSFGVYSRRGISFQIHTATYRPVSPYGSLMMISNKSADIEIWNMGGWGAVLTSPRIMSHDHGKLASAVSDGVYHKTFSSK